MLILSRREAECVCLGDDIVLTIVAVGRDKVRIGVNAPPGVRILRSELESRIELEVHNGQIVVPFEPPKLQTTDRSVPAPVRRVA